MGFFTDTSVCIGCKACEVACKEWNAVPEGTGLEPACAKACPTESIQFGPVDELRERARQRVGELQEAGETGARLYLDDPDDGISGGGAFFLLLDEPEVYGLPPDPVVTTRDLPRMWRHVAIAAAGQPRSARPGRSGCPRWRWSTTWADRGGRLMITNRAVRA